MSTAISISEFNARVAQLIERQIPLLWVKGEISNLTRAASGHWYFSLKDDKAQVRAVMFRHKNTLLNFQPREGDAIEAQVLASLYTARGDFQLNVETMKRAGLGNLYERFLQLKDELQKQGLFDASHKQALPHFVQRIGIVTSPQAAALRDVVKTLHRRSPHIEINLFPTLVQGESAPQQIAHAIGQAARFRTSNQDPLDAILVVRGGGSIEDLWAFNDPKVAHALFNCPIPTISGVGHETDTTISDFVADMRAATPTAAAELISNPSQNQWLSHLETQAHRLKRTVQHRIYNAEQRLDGLTIRLLTPAQRIQQSQQILNQQWLRLGLGLERSVERVHQKCIYLTQRLHRSKPRIDNHVRHLLRQQTALLSSSHRYLSRQEQVLKLRASQLNQLNPQHVLARGYTYVRAQNGSIVYNAQTLQAGDGISIEFADGRVIGTVNHVNTKR